MAVFYRRRPHICNKFRISGIKQIYRSSIVCGQL